MRTSLDILRSFGNVASVTVLAALRHTFNVLEQQVDEGATFPATLIGCGPGMSVQLAFGCIRTVGTGPRKRLEAAPVLASVCRLGMGLAAASSSSSSSSSLPASKVAEKSDVSAADAITSVAVTGAPQSQFKEQQQQQPTARTKRISSGLADKLSPAAIAAQAVFDVLAVSAEPTPVVSQRESQALVAECTSKNNNNNNNNNYTENESVIAESDGIVSFAATTTTASSSSSSSSASSSSAAAAADTAKPMTCSTCPSCTASPPPSSSTFSFTVPSSSSLSSSPLLSFNVLGGFDIMKTTARTSGLIDVLLLHRSTKIVHRVTAKHVVDLDNHRQDKAGDDEGINSDSESLSLSFSSEPSSPAVRASVAASVACA